MGGERPPHEQGAGVLRFRSVWGEGGSRRRQAHEQGLAACEPVVPTAGAAACRRCRRPELPRMGGERPPHEQGAGVLCFRSVWGEGGSRRRQAHEQGLAAYGVFGVCEVSGGMGARFPFAGRFCARERSRRRGYGSARRGRRFGSDVWGLEAGSGLFWGFGDLGIWGFGDLGIWGFGDLGIWGFGDLGIWGFGDLGIWGFGDLGIWGFGDLGIWGFGDAPLALRGKQRIPGRGRYRQGRKPVFSRGAWAYGGETGGKIGRCLALRARGALGVRERRNGRKSSLLLDGILPPKHFPSGNVAKATPRRSFMRAKRAGRYSRRVQDVDKVNRLAER